MPKQMKTKSNKKLPTLLISVGILLIVFAAVGAALLFLKDSGKKIDIADAAKQLEAVMPDSEKRSVGLIEERSDNAMPAYDIDGTDFIGLLELPRLGVKLPIAAEWSKAAFAFRPARYSGSVYDGTLVVGGKYESGNFDFADKTDVGDKVEFTDMCGRVYSFTVKKISHADGIDADTLDGSDLTLFVKKSGGYLIIRCDA